VEHRVAEEVESAIQVLREKFGGDGCVVVVRTGVKRSTDKIKIARELLCGPLLRAFSQKSGGNAREAFLPRRIGDRTGLHNCGETYDWYAVFFHDEQRQPIF